MKKIKVDCDINRNSDGKTYCLFLENDVVLTFANVSRERIRLSYSKGKRSVNLEEEKANEFVLTVTKNTEVKAYEMKLIDGVDLEDTWANSLTIDED